MKRLLFLLFCMAFCSPSVFSQCSIPIEITTTEEECGDFGYEYAVSFLVNRNDVAIEILDANYDLHDKVSGEHAIFGVPSDKWLTISVEAIDENCSLEHTFAIPSCAVPPPHIPTFVDTNRYRILLPTAFSPNGDGINDVFAYAGNNIVELELYVFNRWGNLIFESRDLNTGWDGTYKRQSVSTGVYPYIARVIFENGQQAEKRGSITVLR